MANLNLNQVIIAGRMVADPELKKTQSNVSVCSFRVAVQREFKDANGQYPADFLNVTAWRQSAELVAQYFRKGSSIAVVGSIQTREYTDQQGNKRYATEIIADKVRFVDSKSDGEPAPASAPAQAAQDTAPVAVPNYEPLKSDDDLPF